MTFYIYWKGSDAIIMVHPLFCEYYAIVVFEAEMTAWPVFISYKIKGQCFLIQRKTKHQAFIIYWCCLYLSSAVVLITRPIKSPYATDRWFKSISVSGGRIMVFGYASTAIVGDSMSQDNRIRKANRIENIFDTREWIKWLEMNFCWIRSRDSYLSILRPMPT